MECYTWTCSQFNPYYFCTISDFWDEQMSHPCRKEPSNGLTHYYALELASDTFRWLRMIACDCCAQSERNYYKYWSSAQLLNKTSGDRLSVPDSTASTYFPSILTWFTAVSVCWIDCGCRIGMCWLLASVCMRSVCCVLAEFLQPRSLSRIVVVHCDKNQ